MAYKVLCVLGIYISTAIFGIVNASTCYYYISSSYFYSQGEDGSKYCSRGCCNYDTYDPCCYSYMYDYSGYYNYLYNYPTISAGAIAGIVIGCLIGLGVFITIIICVCNASRNSQRAYGGQVISGTQPTVSYITSSNASHIQQYGQPYVGQVNGGFMMAPTTPAYSKENNSAPPPAYNTVVNNPGYQPTQLQTPTQPSAASSYTSLTPTSGRNDHEYSPMQQQNDANDHYYSTISTVQQTASAPSAN